jgi:hypothetical protein
MQNEPISYQTEDTENSKKRKIFISAFLISIVFFLHFLEPFWSSVTHYLEQVKYRGYSPTPFSVLLRDEYRNLYDSDIRDLKRTLSAPIRMIPPKCKNLKTEPSCRAHDWKCDWIEMYQLDSAFDGTENDKTYFNCVSTFLKSEGGYLYEK